VLQSKSVAAFAQNNYKEKMKMKQSCENDEFHRLAVILYYGTDQQFDQ
jgi:hypothetical protein